MISSSRLSELLVAVHETFESEKLNKCYSTGILKLFTLVVTSGLKGICR
jgi:hypothetical protein